VVARPFLTGVSSYLFFSRLSGAGEDGEVGAAEVELGASSCRRLMALTMDAGVPSPPLLPFDAGRPPLPRRDDGIAPAEVGKGLVRPAELAGLKNFDVDERGGATGEDEAGTRTESGEVGVRSNGGKGDAPVRLAFKPSSASACESAVAKGKQARRSLQIALGSCFTRGRDSEIERLREEANLRACSWKY
jgi:hypothetical protein